MKFLVLALCVCAASAASFGSSSFGAPYQPYKAFSPVVSPAQTAAKAIVAATAPVVAPAAQVAAAAYQVPQQVITKNVPYTSDAEAVVLRSESDIGPEGYNFGYETNNNIKSEAVGTYKQVGDTKVLVTRGSYTYIAPDGTPVRVNYIADENGFQPESDVIPVGPEVPEYVLRSLAYIAAHPQTVEKKF